MPRRRPGPPSEVRGLHVPGSSEPGHLPQKPVVPKVVQEMLGHANIGITLDTYTHLIPDLQDRAARSMEEVLAGGRVGGRTAANQTKV